MKSSQKSVCFYEVSDKPCFISDSQAKEFDSLNEVRKLNPNRLITANTNINSIRNKFKMLKATITDKTDIFLISETKLDSSFPVNQFLINGFTPPYRLDRNANGGGIMLYVRQDIPSKLLSNNDQDSEIENIFVEINLHSKKWLICGTYNSKASHIKNYLQILSQRFNQYFSKYDNIIALGDFNAEMSNNHLQEFCPIFGLTNLIKESTCFKNPEKPTSIDHILTNHPKSFQHSGTYETGLSDFHKLTYAVLKMHYSKQQHKIIKYRCYKNFDHNIFRSHLLKELSTSSLKKDAFDKFKYLVFKVLKLMLR